MPRYMFSRGKSSTSGFFRVAKILKLLPFFFLAEFFELFFVFPNFFSNLQFWIDFLCNIFFRFFQIYGTTVDFIKLKWNWQRFHWNYLKLFETICNCHSFTETGCKKKVVIGVKSAKSPVSQESFTKFHQVSQSFNIFPKKVTKTAIFIVSFTWNRRKKKETSFQLKRGF